MSRSGYGEGEPEDSEQQLQMMAYWGAVASALRGARGQRFLREMLAALDTLPEKELVAETLVGEEGVCAMGAVALARGLDVSALDPEDYVAVAKAFGIAQSMAREISFENDERSPETPGERFYAMRRWVLRNIIVQPDEVVAVQEVEE